MICPACKGANIFQTSNPIEVYCPDCKTTFMLDTAKPKTVTAA